MRDRTGKGSAAFNGDREEVLPGVPAICSGGHPLGIKWFTVQTGNGEFVVGQDTATWYSNIEEMWPSGYTNGDTYRMVRAYGELQEHVERQSTASSRGTR